MDRLHSVSLIFTGEIVSYHKNVVVFGVPRVKYTWPGLNYRWPNKPWPTQLQEDLSSTIQELSMYNPHYLYWYKGSCTPNAYAIVRNLGGLPGAIMAKCSEEKFEFLEDLAAATNQLIYETLDSMSHIPFNFLDMDFVEDSLIGKIIELNESEQAGIGLMSMRSASVEELSSVEVTTPKTKEVRSGSSEKLMPQTQTKCIHVQAAVV